MTTNRSFDFDLIFDMDRAFFTLLYQCKQEVIGTADDGSIIIDNRATLIRATKLTSESERVWHYGDNRPTWLLKFFDDHCDTVETRIRELLNKRAEKEFSNAS